MTTTTQVHRAVAQHLAAAGIGVFRETGAYAAGETGITIKAVPQSPDRIVAVTVYDVDTSSDPTDPRRTFLIQLRFRASKIPTDVDDIGDLAEAALTVEHETWSEVRVQRCYRTSIAPLGADQNGRQERTDNYRLVTQH